MKPSIKAPLIGIAAECVLVSPIVIGGWGHGVPAWVLGWIPYTIHAPAFMLFTFLGVRDFAAVAASVLTMTALWSLLVFAIVRPSTDDDHAA